MWWYKRAIHQGWSFISECDSLIFRLHGKEYQPTKNMFQCFTSSLTISLNQLTYPTPLILYQISRIYRLNDLLQWAYVLLYSYQVSHTREYLSTAATHVSYFITIQMQADTLYMRVIFEKQFTWALTWVVWNVSYDKCEFTGE